MTDKIIVYRDGKKVIIDKDKASLPNSIPADIIETTVFKQFVTAADKNHYDVAYMHATITQHAPADAVSLNTVKADNDIANALLLRHPNTLDHSNSLDHTQGTDQGLDAGGVNAVTAAQAKTAYTHSQAAHAPVNAQANADITKAEIEAKLTGEVSSHSHAGGANPFTIRTISVARRQQ